MEISLEKIELVKDKTGVSYKEAKEALEKANGNEVEAIIAIEEMINENSKETVDKEKVDVIEKLKELIKKGNISRIIFKKDGEVLINLPVNAGLLGAVIAPVAALAGFGAAFFTKCIIEVVKDNGEIINVSDITNEKFTVIKNKSNIIMEDVKGKAEDVYSNVKSKVEDTMAKGKKEKDVDEFYDGDDEGDDLDELCKVDEKEDEE